MEEWISKGILQWAYSVDDFTVDIFFAKMYKSIPREDVKCI